MITEIEKNNYSQLVEYSANVKSKVAKCRDNIDKRQSTSIDNYSQIASYIISITQLLEQEVRV
jgi:hypothetical protein